MPRSSSQVVGATARLRRLLVFCFLLVALRPAGLSQLTALDRYVAEPDLAYSYQLVATYPGLVFTAYVLDLTSQSWLSTAEVDRPIWRHWLTIVVPTQVVSSTGLLLRDGPAFSDRKE